jgi:Conserved TM helix
MFPAVRDWSEAMLTSLAGGLAMFFGAIPKILAFAVIMVVGWFIASLIARVVASLLRAVKFNELSARSGFGGFVSNIGVQTDSSGFLALVAKWFIRLIVMVVAFDALGLPAVSDVLRQLLLWLPNLAVGIVVLVIGGLLANAAAGVVRGATASAGLRHPDVIANIVRAAVWVFAIIIAVNQIGIAQTLVNTLFMGAVGLAVIAFGLAFGLGGRDIAKNLLERWYQESEEKGPQMREAAGKAGQQASRMGREGGGVAPAPGYRSKEEGE